MKLLLPYFIILIVVIQLKLRKNTKNNKERMSKFWEKELSANSVRKKDISNLNYITIPDSLPTININDTKILKDYETINKLRERKILNLSGMSNTNIKLEYGVGNLAFLSECDDNFVLLVRTLDELGHLLFSQGYETQGCEIFEYAVYIGSDIKATYTALADYYNKNNNKNGIDKLLLNANSIQTSAKDRIVEYINSVM